MSRPIPSQAITLVEQFEGCSLTPYQDSDGIWTQGYGHTEGVTADSPPITADQADALLAQDMAYAGEDVENEVTVPLNDNQFSALVSFVFNVGAGNFAGSGLLKVLNAGNYTFVPDHLAQWNKSGGRVIDGLTRRRRAEIILWQTPI